MRLAWILAAACAVSAAQAAPAVTTHDVIVIGATPGGIMAAVAAAREGASVLLLHYLPHVGGMVASGLGKTDIGNPAVVGGLAHEFFTRVGAAYGSSEPAYTFEPHVAEAVFLAMIQDEAPRLDLVLNQTLLSVGIEGGVVTNVSTAMGA